MHSSVVLGEAFEELGLDSGRWAFCHHESRNQKEIEKKENESYLFGTPVAFADVLASIEMSEDVFDGLLLLHLLLVLQAISARASLLLLGLESLLNELNVLEPQLFADDVQISRGVDITLDVNDLCIIEAAHNLEDGIDGTDVGQERISKTSTGGRATGQTSNVIDSEIGGNDRFGLVFLY
jgi:hypothetical protein